MGNAKLKIHRAAASPNTVFKKQKTRHTDVQNMKILVYVLELNIFVSRYKDRMAVNHFDDAKIYRN